MCTGKGTCLSVNEPSGPLFLHLARAPPVWRLALCARGTPRTANESEGNTI